MSGSRTGCWKYSVSGSQIFFVNFQFIMLNPCLYGWNLDYFHSSVNFCELGTRYTGIFLRTSVHEIVNTPCPAVQISRIVSLSNQNIFKS